jgi:hypothetical protein
MTLCLRDNLHFGVWVWPWPVCLPERQAVGRDGV